MTSRQTHTRRCLATALALLAALPSACNDEETTDCLNIYVYAFSVFVVDANGKAVSDAKVSYSQNGGPEAPTFCFASGTGGCSSWSVPGGSDQSGTYVVEATSADGARSATATVHVQTTGPAKCPVPIAQKVTLTLQ